MISGRWMAGLGLGALIAAGVAVAPALQARESGVAAMEPSRSMIRSIDSFTPAAADPKLAAVLAQSGMAERGFRFTPSASRRPANRAVTVAVRARTNRTVGEAERSRAAAAQPESLSLAPIAYNLGASVGWQRFAVSADVTRVDLVSQPGGTERTEVGVSYRGDRAGARVSASNSRPVEGPAPKLVGSESQRQTIDVMGSYSLTRNLDVTAGVRYERSERERLPRLTDDRRDSQAVYVGTAFRF